MSETFDTRCTFEYEYPTGTTYAGEYCVDESSGEQLFHGIGTLTFHNNDTYSGEFSKDEMHGVGTYCYNCGDKYHGGFSNDKFDGIGKYQYKDGAVFKGKFRNDMRVGKFVIAENGKLYETILQDDVEVTGSRKEISPEDITSGKYRKLSILSEGDI